MQLCEAVHYVINSTNCGICPNITYSTYAMCSDLDLTSSEKVCSLGVKTVVCDDLVGENSQTIQVMTKGNYMHIHSIIISALFVFNPHLLITVPNSPTNVQVIPTFHYYSNKLIIIKLNVSFSDETVCYPYSLPYLNLEVI